MKKNFYLLSAALAALCLVSCAKEQLANEEGNTPTGNFIEFSATTEGDDAADGLKTYISTPREDGSYAVRWNSGEAINVNGVKSAGAVIVDGSYNTKANFKVEMDPAAFYCAVSPYGLYSDKSFNSETKTMDVFVKADAQYKTSDQEGKNITYDPTTALIVAYSTTTELQFQHMMTYYQIKVTGKAEGKKIRKITVSQNGSNPNIAGVYKLTFSDQGKIEMTAKNLTKTITYECGEAGIDLETPMMIALPSVKFTNGVTFTIYYTDGTSQAQFAKTLDLSSSRGKVVPADFPYREDTGVRTIKSAADWEAFAIAVQAANRENNPDSTALNHWLDNGVVTLAGDITLPGDFTRVANTFNNTFDGGGHTITIEDGTHALFFTLGYNSVIKNLITAGSIVGGNASDGVTVLANSLYGTIQDCTNNATITVNKAMHIAAAPFAKAVNHGVISNCVNNGDITVTCDATASNYNAYAGGIVARVYPSGEVGTLEKPAVSILNCRNTGNIDVLLKNDGHQIGYAGYGGIAGWTNRSSDAHKPYVVFEGCVNEGNITVANTKEPSKDAETFAVSVGGILGLGWGDYVASVDYYRLGVPTETRNTNLVYFKNCTNSGTLKNNAIGAFSKQKLYFKSYTGGIAGSLYGRYTVAGGPTEEGQAILDGCVSSGEVMTFSVPGTETDIVRNGLSSVAGGLVGLGGKLTIKNCTVTAAVGNKTRIAFAVSGAIGVVAGKFYMENCKLYPKLSFARCFYTAQDNWSLVATYPKYSNTTNWGGPTVKDTGILFAGASVPTIKPSSVKNCELGAAECNLTTVGYEKIPWNYNGELTGEKNLTDVVNDKFRKDIATTEKFSVQGLSGVKKTESTADHAVYCGKDGDVTFSDNTLITSAPAVTTAAPAPMALNAGNTYNY